MLRSLYPQERGRETKRERERERYTPRRLNDMLSMADANGRSASSSRMFARMSARTIESDDDRAILEADLERGSCAFRSQRHIRYAHAQRNARALLCAGGY